MAYKKYSTQPKRDHYQEVTDQIVAALEQGIVPWRRTWNQGACGMPMNCTTGRLYRGINTLLLGLAQAVSFGDDPRWCSYRQAQSRGWQVRSGERGRVIVFYKRILKQQEAREDGTMPFFQLLRFSTVFHASQIKGVPAYIQPELGSVSWQTPAAIETIIENSGVDMRYGGGQAFYSPLTDHVQMPPRESFESQEAFAQTACHELGHYAANKRRLGISEGGRFGSREYAAEELRVEISAAMVCSTLGINPDIPNTAAYVSNWLERLKNDNREIFRAAADAQRIADYLLGFHPDYAAYLAGQGQQDADDNGTDDDPEIRDAA
jgi:antirestriction protein ArdC